MGALSSLSRRSRDDVVYEMGYAMCPKKEVLPLVFACCGCSSGGICGFASFSLLLLLLLVVLSVRCAVGLNGDDDAMRESERTEEGEGPPTSVEDDMRATLVVVLETIGDPRPGRSCECLMPGVWWTGGYAFLKRQ